MGDSILLLSYYTIAIVHNLVFVVDFDPSLYYLSNLIERNYCAYSNSCKFMFPHCYAIRFSLIYYRVSYSVNSLSSYLSLNLFILSPTLSSPTLSRFPFFYSLHTVPYFLIVCTISQFQLKDQ